MAPITGVLMVGRSAAHSLEVEPKKARTTRPEAAKRHRGDVVIGGSEATLIDNRPLTGEHDQGPMLPRTMRSRLLASTLALIVAFASTAICLAGAASRPAAHDCCPKMEQRCGKLSAPADCCLLNAPNSLAAISNDSGASLASQAFVVTDAVADDPSARLSVLGALEAGSLRPPRTPTYLLVSVFRI